MTILIQKIYLYFRGENITCSKAWLQKLGDTELDHALDIENKRRKCLTLCEYQTITPSFTSSTFPIKSTFQYSSSFCLTLFKVARICQEPIRAKIFEESLIEYDLTCHQILLVNNTIKICSEHLEPIEQYLKDNPNLLNFIYHYTKENFVVLQVYISNSYYTLFKRDEQISAITFISNTGGLLGLCMGMSFISIFEMFYYFGHILWTKLCKCIQEVCQLKLKVGNASDKVQKF
jgi:hypothetical protein